MDIVEFVETILEIQLLESQKKLLREFSKKSKDAVLVRTRNHELIPKLQQKPLSPDEIDICPKCNGSGLNIRGVMCPKCQGSGHWKKGEKL